MIRQNDKLQEQLKSKSKRNDLAGAYCLHLAKREAYEQGAHDMANKIKSRIKEDTEYCTRTQDKYIGFINEELRNL